MKKELIKIAAASLLIASTSANAVWTIKDLGAFDGNFSAATAINNSGQISGIVGCCGGIVGHSYITGPDGIGSAIIGGFTTWAQGINDSGQVAGSDGRPFFTGPNGVGLTYIGTSSGGANDINNLGQVVGNLSAVSTGSAHAFITGPNGTGITDLGTLGGDHSVANGVNNNGQVTGYYHYSIDDSYHAFITDSNGTGIRNLGALGGDQSEGREINDSGQVVGWSTTEIGGQPHAFVTGPNGTGMIDLGTMGGKTSGSYSINNLGEVVGYAGFGHECPFCTPDAFLYSHGIMVNLTRLDEVLSAGWTKIVAVDINDNGQIVGHGMIGGVQHAFLLSGADEEFFRTYVPVPAPIPEPTTYAMLLAGLGLLLFRIKTEFNS
jgi:probable HAF family extracellular repeat protein